MKQIRTGDITIDAVSERQGDRFDCRFKRDD
jgi:hypothetical protein